MGKDNGVSERLFMVYNWLLEQGKVPNKKAFAEKIGVSPSFITEISKGRSNVGVSAIQNTVKEYGVSSDWLLNGVGEMFRESPSSNKQEDRLQVEHILPEGAIPMSKVKMKALPLIPYEAAAGILRGEEEGIRLEDCEHYLVPFFTDADFLIYIVGDSMQPTFNSGDLAACKFVPSFDLFFQWGKPYIIATDEGILLKRVYEKGRENVSFVSDNEKYVPLTFPREQIYQVARVLGVVRHD